MALLTLLLRLSCGVALLLFLPMERWAATLSRDDAFLIFLAGTSASLSCLRFFPTSMMNVMCMCVEGEVMQMPVECTQNVLMQMHCVRGSTQKLFLHIHPHTTMSDHRSHVQAMYIYLSEMNDVLQRKYGATIYVVGVHAICLWGMAPMPHPTQLNDVAILLIAGDMASAAAVMESQEMAACRKHVPFIQHTDLQTAQMKLQEGLAAQLGGSSDQFSGSMLGQQICITGKIIEEMVPLDTARVTRKLMVAHPCLAAQFSPEAPFLTDWINKDIMGWQMARGTVLNVGFKPLLPDGMTAPNPALEGLEASAATEATEPKAEPEPTPPKPPANLKELQQLREEVAELRAREDTLKKAIKTLREEASLAASSFVRERDEGVEHIRNLNAKLEAAEHALDTAEKARQEAVRSLKESSSAHQAAVQKTSAMEKKMKELSERLDNTMQECVVLRKEAEGASKLHASRLRTLAEDHKEEMDALKAQHKEEMQQAAEQLKAKASALAASKRALSAKRSEAEAAAKRASTDAKLMERIKASEADKKESMRALEISKKALQRTKVQMRKLETENERLLTEMVMLRKTQRLAEATTETRVNEATHAARAAFAKSALPYADALWQRMMGSGLGVRPGEGAAEESKVVEEDGEVQKEEEMRRRSQALVSRFRKERQELCEAVRVLVFQLASSSVCMDAGSMRANVLKNLPFIAKVTADGFSVDKPVACSSAEKPWYDSLEATIPWEHAKTVLSGPYALAVDASEAARVQFEDDDQAFNRINALTQEQELFMRVLDMYRALRLAGEPHMKKAVWTESCKGKGWYRVPVEVLAMGLWTLLVHASALHYIEPVLLPVIMWLRTCMGEEAVNPSVAKGMHMDAVLRKVRESGSLGSLRVVFTKGISVSDVKKQMPDELGPGKWRVNTVAGVHMVMDVDPFIEISKTFMGSASSITSKIGAGEAITREDVNADVWTNAAMEVVSGVAASALRALFER